ncbi:MAG TPA: hypothetical protein VE130_02980 [Nitrososphaeraceae archaeon]|nr:hypothetical protein [Nitrososphaeraceae archaeon]
MIVSTLVDMLIGMILGMIASPVMMKMIKSIRQRRKVNRLLREAAEDHLERKDFVNNDDQNSRIL